MSRQPTLVVFASLCLLAAAAVGEAATLTVNSAADDTPGGDGLVTLREAVEAANADGTTDLGDTGSGADTIVFDGALAGATIELVSAADTSFGPSALAITSDVTIDGAGAPFLTVARSGAVARLRLFYVSGAGTLRLERITLEGGAAIGFDGGETHRGGTGGGGAGLGGAVFNQGTLEIVESTLAGNQATGGMGGPQSNIFDTFPRGGSGGGGTAGDGGDPTGGCCAFDVGGAGGAGGGGAGGDGSEAPSGGTAGSAGGFGGGAGGGGGNANDPAFAGGAGGFGGGGGGGGGGQTGQAGGAGGAAGFGGGAGATGGSSGSISTPGGGGGGGAGMGGAVFNHGGTVTVVNSTFSGNSAAGGAGGRGNGGAGQGLGGAIFNRNGTLDVLAATVTGNGGGGIYNLGDAGGTASATIEGTILANSSSGNDFVSATNAGGLASAIGDDNLIESESGFGGTVVSTADPQLGALADNDGPTETHLPALASPVIDAATTLAAPAADQRGVARPQGAANDIGSVELVLNQPPVAVCTDVTVHADAACLGHATAADVDGGSFDPDGDPITLEISPAGPFPLGDTVVELTVTDDGDLSDTCTATVTVVDVTPPVIACPPDAVFECPADTSPAATGFATAADNCSVDSIVFADVSVPGCGGTVTITRTWTATDGSGNQAGCVQTVQTIDTTPPVVIPGPDNAVCLWPPNHKFVHVENVTAAVVIVDACDPAPFAADIACASDQCDNAPCPEHPGENGDGNTVNDCAYDAGTDTLSMRSERAGTDPDGRTYSLSVTAADACGNVAEPVVTFTGHVPHHASPGMQCLKP
jgi:hypothetical protein